MSTSGTRRHQARRPAPRGARLRVTAVMAAAALAQALVVANAAPTAAADDLTVSTTSGPVTGIVANGAKQWRGVPYADPPVGNQRWRPPQAATPWTSPRDASQFEEPCAQADFFTGALVGSEDCLYVNVSAPAGASSQDGLPVMVHLHPGGNVRGEPYQNAPAFTDRGVIVVTVGYRLGAFGFMGHPALSREGGGASGEYGLLDQIAALTWVRDNIAAFGGAPSNVTLFGFSAGAFDTVALMSSPLSRHLLARAAVQSGEVRWGLTGQFNTIAEAERMGVAGAERVGCGDAEDVLTCLRSVPAERLAAETQAAGFVDVIPWVGGSVLPRAPEALLRDQAVPLLVGFNREEQSGFFPPPQPPLHYSRGTWVADTNLAVGALYGPRVRAQYPPDAYDAYWWDYITLLTDVVRGCPTRRMANIVSGHSPVYRYLYTHTFSDPFVSQFRTAHGLEDVLLWQNDFEFFSMTPDELNLADLMTDYWTNFAKTGDPNGPGLPTWPAYDANDERLLALDTPTSTMSRYHRDQCAVVDTVPIAFPYPWENGPRPPELPVGIPPGFR